MEEDDMATSLEKMEAPSYKLLVTTPMAAIMLSGKESSEWAGLLESIGPIYAAAADDTHGEVSEALSTVSVLLERGDALIRMYFKNESLSFDRMMELSATGADVWMLRLSDGEIEKADAIRLFQTIQAGLMEAIGDLRGENEMVDQFIKVQDKIIEHISSLD